ncbi:uncharacterized protein CTHT_0030740 [Thermochaetoides thermophila DSM 1495]|uniref:DUF221 domain-containing protein n=1 Tax=Chaetomium thermophilum (strain DSM 1495 / CBS 144.50 / IMI 039719) TaxID=759272 RepID=G0S453_CHATD|nr:hypothetical protein CTHT_0030740 [Thermochaetoides thermophila DSM 1495]EGS21227.1 hypothetical protein CTHT_0030740 [Thermochaetoides thermophila DSM 1495]
MDTARLLQERDGQKSSAEILLQLLSDPFASQLQQSSVYAALGSSLGITAAIAIAFSFLRPYNSVVYAPKLKHADEKHAPPPLGKGLFAWISPLWSTSEEDLVHLAGMDAAIFMRFTRMCRNIFVILSVLGCGILIPVNWTNFTPPDPSWLYQVTPRNVWGAPLWATVVFAWLLTLIVCGFLWWNYRKVLQLRRTYFKSEEYQQSLHSRTLMLYDIPKSYTSDEGIARIIDKVAPHSSFARTVVARDVKVLPALLEEHEKTVRKLEKVLAKYLKDPNNLPATRPTCLPSKKDPSYSSYPKGQKLDAIDYLTQRIKTLELEIKDVRQRIDKRGSMPYGFASFADIAEAHAIAYACRKKKHGAVVTLAPRPNDIIWDNMPLSSTTRSTRRLWNNLWITILTILWIVPNAFIAIFLVNLGNLGNVWPAFKRSLERNGTTWSLIQGIASPALMSLVYVALPIIFRRMSIKAGDQTKTGRERHVVAKLYSFFVFNNLIVFSVFSALWSFIANVVQRTESGADTWKAIVDSDFGLTVFLSICTVSPFWISWLLQRQLGAAVDLAQLWTLVYSFAMRKFSSPTPRELIELTAPPPFDYASYYNYFLYYSTIALCYAAIQPLVLPAAALYFCIDVGLKKYLLLYVFVTKTESGGMFWRILFNRFLFASILSHMVVFLVVWVRGDASHVQAYAVAPLPFLMIAFKIYCSRAFDHKIQYYATRYTRQDQMEAAKNFKEQGLCTDKLLAARFGHPAIFKPLITPMVHAKAQNLLASIYRGRPGDGYDGDTMSVSGYSDSYALDNMSSGQAGKTSPSIPGFEVVPESRLDFEFYKNRDEFAADHGAGELFGRPSDIIRPDTPGMPGSEPNSRPGTPAGGMGFAGRRAFSPYTDDVGSSYRTPQQYSPYDEPSHYSSAARHHPTNSYSRAGASGNTLYGLGSGSNDSGANLVINAAGMPISNPGYRSHTPSSYSSTRAPGMLGGGPRGYGGLPQTDHDEHMAPQSYDYFRGSNNRRRPGEASETGRATPPGAAPRSGGHIWGGN